MISTSAADNPEFDPKGRVVSRSSIDFQMFQTTGHSNVFDLAQSRSADMPKKLVECLSIPPRP
jgi:hypothetical protein